MCPRRFWHKGREDFFAQARAIPGFVELKAECYTYYQYLLGFEL
jgi:hypothetical protein